jgi:hypothetical protein
LNKTRRILDSGSAGARNFSGCVDERGNRIGDHLDCYGSENHARNARQQDDSGWSEDFHH